MDHIACKACRDRERRLVELRRDLSHYKERVDFLEPELDALRERVAKLKADRDKLFAGKVEGPA